jgi:hypothetical protein
MSAAATGMRAEKMLDFATPNVLIVPTHNVNARLEQSIARQRIGCQAFTDIYTDGSKSSRPFHMKSGSRKIDPIRN